MEAGDFADVLKRSAINPKYNEAINCISIINEHLARIEDQLDGLITQDVSPQTEQEIIKHLEVLQGIKASFDGAGEE